ncbi:MAG: DUF1385 domain-containing protein [Lachnospiraceae bacterium]|nr:DUF1385 domain-containing protein [Lachnospiraceae bacterium]
MKYSGIGGQAVLEGVMMKNGADYAVAVRRPDGEIECKKDHKEGILQRHPALDKPLIRGSLILVDSMVLGIDTLNYSASFYDEEDPAPSKEKESSLPIAFAVAASLLLVIGLFILLPSFLSQLLGRVVSSRPVLAVFEALIRIALFVGYVAAISLMKDIRRVFMYHGAEHKCINCVEHGLPLTVENAAKSSRFHKRCGTSFMIGVMILSAVFFMFLQFDSILLRLVTRLILIPVIAGISYEFLRLAGSGDSVLTNILSRPGLWMQRLTTREPDSDMLEVAITSVEAVFDWKAYLKENFGEDAVSACEGPSCPGL